MKTRAGLWLDHQKAVIVNIKDKQEETQLVFSTAEKQHRRSGDSPLEGSYESYQVPADDSRERKLTRQRDVYYEKNIGEHS